MNQIASRPSLGAVRQVLAARSERCSACGRRVERVRPNVRLHGAWFHRSCAEYRPRFAVPAEAAADA
jgi:hypothetical protein